MIWIKTPSPLFHPFQPRYGSDEDSDSEVGGSGGVREVDLRLSTLQSLHAKGETINKSTYSLSGAKKSRIKELLQNPCCPCKCNAPLKVLCEVCRVFWSLPKESQDAILWSLQQSENGSGRSKFFIEGQGLQTKIHPMFYKTVSYVSVSFQQ